MFNSFLSNGSPRSALGLLAALTLAGGAWACSVSGPPSRDAPKSTEAFPIESGYYRFAPGVQFSDGPQLGEVYFSRTKSRENPRGLFLMRVLGRDRKGAIRVRQYEGEALRFGSRAELRAERCYLFGKREWDDRMSPLKRWECDHLVFVFESPSDFTRIETLQPVLDHPRTEYSDWFAASPLVPMPGNETGAPGRSVFFAGQIFPTEAGEILPDDATVVVWGYDAGRLLRDGQVLEVYGHQNNTGESGAADANPIIGKLKIISRPGDFLLCRWTSPQTLRTGVAFTRESLQNSGGVLFD